LLINEIKSPPKGANTNMKPRKLRRRMALASSLGAGAFSAALALSAVAAGTASAATIPTYPGTPTVPNPAAPVPSFGTYPNWLPYNATTGAEPISNVDHSEGSDTTLFVMQSISNLYSHAGILPFTCGVQASQTGDCLEPSGSYNGGGPTFNQGTAANPNNTQSDETDNFSGTEELQGQSDVGSGNGQAMLCGGTPSAPAGTTVNYSRSSKPFGVSGCAGQGVGFAKDAVLSVDFTTINPGAYGSATGYLAQTEPQCNAAGVYPSYSAPNGSLACTGFPTSGLIGPVADGWLPGDPTNCGTGGGGTACSGTPFTDVNNTSGLTSVPYRLFCQHGPAGALGSATPNESQITDWGQLTNLSAAANGGTAQTVGNGAPIGVPIRIVGINSGSGTVATMYAFDQSGVGQNTNTGAHCLQTTGFGAPSSGDVNANAASGANPQKAQGPAGSNFVQNPEISVENSTSQIGDFAFANWGSSCSGGSCVTDAADQAVDIATSLYSESRGAYLSSANDEITSIVSAGAGATGGVGSNPSTFTANVMTLNGVTLHNTVPIIGGTYPTARTLFNIFRTDKVNASTGGFLNWGCDSQSAVQKGTDHVIGGNLDTDLTNIIANQYKFVRITDLTPEIDVAAQTPADHAAGGDPNGTCQANLGISSVSSDGTTITLSAPVPSAVQQGWTVNIPTGSSWVTSGTPTVLLIGNGSNGLTTSQFTVSSPLVTGSGTSSPPTVYFPGHPPVLGVTDPAS
jgi:hypothetical protein